MARGNGAARKKVRVGALLGLLAALGYGAADFVGGLGGRRTRPGIVAVVAQAVGVAATSVAVVVVPGTGPTRPSSSGAS